MSLKSVVPKEINEHLRLYSKEPWEVQFLEECGVCGGEKLTSLDYVGVILEEAIEDGISFKSKNT